MTDIKYQAHRHQAVLTVWALAVSAILPVSTNSWAGATGEQQGQESAQDLAATVERTEATFEAQARIDGIFSESSDAMEQGQRCLPARRIRGVNVLDNRTLVFDMGRDENYLVRLKRQCFGLRKDTPISYEVHGSQFCKHDGFRALETWSTNQLVPGPRCSIPAFIPLTDTEKELVKARVKADRDAKIAERKAEKAARRAAKEAAKAASLSDPSGERRQDGENA